MSDSKRAKQALQSTNEQLISTLMADSEIYLCFAALLAQVDGRVAHSNLRISLDLSINNGRLTSLLTSSVTGESISTIGIKCPVSAVMSNEPGSRAAKADTFGNGA